MEQSVTIPSIDIIIVNWNAGTQLFDCLMSLVNAGTTGIQIKTVARHAIKEVNETVTGYVRLWGALPLILKTAVMLNKR